MHLKHWDIQILGELIYSKECVDICKNNGFDVQLVDERTEKSFYKSHKVYLVWSFCTYVLEHYSPSDAAVLLTSSLRCFKERRKNSNYYQTPITHFL